MDRVWIVGKVETEEGVGLTPMEMFVLAINYSCVPLDYVEYQLGRKNPSSETGFECLAVLEDTENSLAEIFKTQGQALNYEASKENG